MKSRILKRSILCMGILSICVLGRAQSATHAESQEDKAVKKLVGVWRLISVEGTDPTLHPAIDNPTGLIIYDRSGWMAVQIAWKGNRKLFLSRGASGTPEEKAAAFDSYVSYYGKYTLDLKAQTVTHHIEDHSYPGARGRNNVRWFEFQGNDRLLLIPCEDGKGGIVDRMSATYKLFWERVGY